MICLFTFMTKTAFSMLNFKNYKYFDTVLSLKDTSKDEGDKEYLK